MDFHISSLLPMIDPSELRPKVKSPRAYAVSLFVEKLNSLRGGRKELSKGFIAMKMSHLDVEDLHAFYKQCEDADCGFSSKWWSELKTDSKTEERRNMFKRKYLKK